MSTSVQTVPASVSQPAPSVPEIPPLENGDRLSREEFERRYEAMPHLKKAELIEGVVYVSSPVNFERHAEQHGDLMGILAVYRVYTPGVRLADNGTVRLDLDNEPQPDGTLLIDPRCGGQAQVDTDGMIAGAPELAAEVASSSVSYDLGPKLRAYRCNGVREYLVWRVLDRVIDWFILRGSQYEPLPPDSFGVYHSEVFPGLWLDAAALLASDLVKVHEVLRQGLASAEHAAFVARLQASRAV